METKEFSVIKRDKTKEILSYNKIYNRTKTLGDIYNINIEFSALVTKIIRFDVIQHKRVLGKSSWNNSLYSKLKLSIKFLKHAVKIKNG